MNGLRLYKGFKIFSGLKLHLSKTGMSVTFGSGPVKINTGTHGTYLYTDLPVGGSYYRRRLDQIGKGK